MYTKDSIISVIRSKGYEFFSTPRGYDLNIVGIRTSDDNVNQFNDLLCVLYCDEDFINLFAFPATTDPGWYWRENPMNVDGTAILKEGQYRGAYQIGKHKEYPALQQKRPMVVYRDSNRDKMLDLDPGTEEEGVFGINIHRASSHRASDIVDKWSAGCQVFQDPIHFDFFMNLCRKSADKFGNSFTYTLLSSSDF